MATLAHVFSRVFPNTARVADAARVMDASIRVRAFANEDIYFHVKRIDNSRLVRQSDPVSRGKCWKMIGSVVGAAVLMVGVLLPGAYNLLAGYQVQSLLQENERLATEQASLELKEAELVSPARMEELARIQQMVDPAPQRLVYLDAKQGSLAMTRQK